MQLEFSYTKQKTKLGTQYYFSGKCLGQKYSAVFSADPHYKYPDDLLEYQKEKALYEMIKRMIKDGGGLKEDNTIIIEIN